MKQEVDSPQKDQRTSIRHHSHLHVGGQQWGDWVPDANWTQDAHRCQNILVLVAIVIIRYWVSQYGRSKPWYDSLGRWDRRFWGEFGWPQIWRWLLWAKEWRKSASDSAALWSPQWMWWRPNCRWTAGIKSEWRNPKYKIKDITQFS